MFQRLCFAFIGLFFSFSLFAQHLTISTATESGSYSISGNTLTVATAGAVILNPSVITNHLNTTGDLTIVMPQNGLNQRSLYLNAAINYTGSTARTLTFQIGNEIIATSGISVTSTNAPLNVVFRSATYSIPDNGRVRLDGVTINTNGGHLWIGGGVNNDTWNGLTVGNNYSTVWEDDLSAISIVGSTINTNGGAIGMKGLSWESADDDGTSNYGINIENASISSASGNISIVGLLKGRYTNGTAVRINSSTSTNSISTTSGSITILGTGEDQTTNGNGWRQSVGIYATSPSASNTISSLSGNISIQGTANFAASVNDKEGLGLGGNGLRIISQTGNITLKGSNSLETSGQYSNSIRFTAGDVNNAIRIGFDGNIAYSGNIFIEGNSIYQRTNNAGTGSISIQSTGSLTIQPSGDAFTYMRAGDSGTLTYDNDWNFGTTLSSFTLGKTPNSANLSFANVLTVAGSLNLYAGQLTLNSNLTTTASSGGIYLFSDNALLIPSSRTFNSAGIFSYAARNTSFSVPVSYPFNNLTVSCNGLTIGKVDNTANVTISSATSIPGPINIYGGALTLPLNANLNTTNTTTGNILLQGTSLSGLGNIGLAAGRTASISVSASSTYGGIISGSGSGLTKLGAGLLTLTKDHTYTGATNINAGDLQVGTGGSVSQASSGTIASTSAVVVASGSKLILSPNENITFTAPISGAGGVEIKGASGSYYNAFLTATPATIATNSTVLEVLTRITGGLQQGLSISTSAGEVAGAYFKSYDAANNTATLQLQQFEGTYTKCVFVRLSQSGTNVQISVNTSIYNGAAYRSAPSQVGQDMSTGSSPMGFTSSANSAGYGISMVFMSGKVNFTGALSYTGNTTLSSVTTTSSTSPFIYSYTSKGTQEITNASSAFPAASTVVNNGLVIFNRTSALTIASDMSGTEDILQVGSPITLSGACTHSGNTTIDLNKSLIVGNGATAGSITGNIINYGSLTFNRSDNSSYPGIISGTGTLVKSGAGEHTLTGLHTFTGTTTINAGKLTISRDVPAFSSTSINGAGELVLQPTSTSFTNAVSYPISGITVGGIGGLTLGKSGNLANITFATSLSIAGPITAYGGTINVNANLSSTLNGAAILLQGSKVVHSPGVTVQTTAGNITYTATNAPWTASSDQCILVGTSGNSTLSTMNAQGGNISLSGSFATTGVTNTSENPDVALMFFDSKLQTLGSGTITLNGNAFNNQSVNSQFIWGVMFVKNTILQTQNGNISVTGRPGSANGNGRGIVADGTNSSQVILKALSSTGTIQFTESMPVGHINSNYTGAYFKPSATAGTVQFGSDGTLVQSSSNIIFDTDRITFDGTNPTVFNTTGTITIQPVSDAFKSSVSFSNISAPSITGLTIGKSTNTENLSIGSTTAVNGPITLHGGALTLGGALTTTNTTTGNMSLNGTTLTGGSLSVADGRTLTMKLSSNTNYTGAISGTGLNFVKDGAGFLKLLPTPSALSFAAMTISGGGFILNPNQQLSLSGLLTNNGTFTMKDGATFLQKTSGTSIEGNGTFKVEKLLTGNSNSAWTNTSGRFWYMGVPMVNVARSGYGNYVSGSNHVWSYSEVNKQYTDITSNAATLSAGTGYVHRRSTNDTLIFSAIGAAGLYGSDASMSALTKNAGNTAGVHLISNPYMAYVDWELVHAGSTNIDATFYTRTTNTTSNNISAIISYNATTNLETNNSSVTATAAQLSYIAPMQSIWVRVLGNAGATGTVNMTRSMLSHQGGVALKSSTVFPNLARVNLVDGNNFDQLLVYLNSDMSNEVDEYDSEKMAASGSVQIYTMSSNKKLVMNGLKNNKKKVSVPLYLELPQTKSYTLQLSEYMVEDGLILLEDKQEGTMQDFTINENYTFYANSGLLQNRFVLHFILPNAELATQGPSNNWVAAEEGSYTEGGDVEISNDAKGNIEITLNQAAETKVEGTVFVTDMNGKEVYKGQLEGIITAIELDVPSGIYYLTVQSGTLIEKKKVFIQE